MSSANLTTDRSTSLEILIVSEGGGPPIHADLARSRGPAATLIIPGFWRTRSDPVMRKISSRLHEHGLTVCTVDNRGHGDSGGTFGFNTHESDDVIRVLESLRKSVPSADRCCVIGFSAGGSIALSAAARRPDLVQGLILVSPVADFKRVLPRPSLFGWRRQLSVQAALRPPRFWWHERARRHALEDARLVEAPVCLIHVKNDWLVHHSHAEMIAASLPSRPEVHLLDLDRAHAERIFDADDAPWSLLFGGLDRMLGLSPSAS